MLFVKERNYAQLFVSCQSHSIITKQKVWIFEKYYIIQVKRQIVSFQNLTILKLKILQWYGV